MLVDRLDDSMPWYTGETMLEKLESPHASAHSEHAEAIPLPGAVCMPPTRLRQP